MRATPSGRSPRGAHSPAFTLVEILVVIAVVTTLVGLTMPALRGARGLARRTVCSARMLQPATLLRLYAGDHRERFPRTQDASYGVVHPSWDPGVKLEKTWVDLLCEQGYLGVDLETAGVPRTLICPSAEGYDNDASWAGHMPHFGVNFHLSPPRRLESLAGQRSFFGRPFSYGGDQSTKIMMAESKHLANDRGWFSIGNSNWVAMRHGAGRAGSGSADTGMGANVVYLDGHVAFRTVSDDQVTQGAAQPFAGINFWRDTPR